MLSLLTLLGLMCVTCCSKLKQSPETHLLTLKELSTTSFEGNKTLDSKGKDFEKRHYWNMRIHLETLSVKQNHKILHSSVVALCVFTLPFPNKLFFIGTY